ncbi:hypothetical protein [Pseudoblastomonas halimionae]|uniref:DoxX family protein n=1 Tax=Alteriqipengyuania halimionae TaxID=1926630 RepID=A0A6I4U3Y8_9SPHN|nr:hypothetical protein [Alteriqipengyuania halimionae]MXP10819.1 hypothetical protein [Alteriqipengyuania halimionae]
MAILLVFLLGVGNFAAHKAALASNHPALQQMPWFHLMHGRFSLALEFIVLLGAMLLAADGSHGWVLAYMVYSVFNILAAWMIVTGKV